MVHQYTCILLLAATALAVHEHYQHLSLDYVAKETRRLTYMDQDGIYAKIENNKMAVKIIMERREAIYNKAETEADGLTLWKHDYEEDYCDDIDRALIVQEVCNILYKSQEKCDVGIKWNHPHDTRDETLRSEFLKEVEDTIIKTLEKVREERESRGKDL